MAIRFECPSCRQPIEVEDAWAGQSVACCYCHNVVTAPRESTWPAGPVPTAERPTASPAHMDVWVGGRQAGGAVGGEGSHDGWAGWALTLSLAGTVLATLGWLMWMGALAARMIQKVGPDATQAEQTQALQELFASGQGYALPAAAIVVFVVGLCCGIGGLVLSVRALLAGTHRRGIAIAACILGACVSFCQIIPLLSAAAARHIASAG